MNQEITKREARRIILVAIVIFLMGVIVGMELQILGVDAAEVKTEEILTNDQALREGGGMPCMAAPEESKKDEPEAAEEPAAEETVTRYSVNGYRPPAYIEEHLIRELEKNGILYWYPHALCQIYGESNGDIFAENPNGQDKGLLQYRLQYWPAVSAQYGVAGADIFDPLAQITVYAAQTAERIARTGSLEQTISQHKQSEYGPFDAAYTAYIRSYEHTLREVAR